jgi:hypothetical protein
MSALYKILLALIALPVLFVLFHDINRYFTQPNVQFSLRAAGYYWVYLSPDSYKIVSETLPKDMWETIRKILIYPAVYIFGMIALVIYALLGLIRQLFFEEKNIMARAGRLDFLNDDNKPKRGYKYSRRR